MIRNENWVSPRSVEDNGTASSHYEDTANRVKRGRVS